MEEQGIVSFSRDFLHELAPYEQFILLYFINNRLSDLTVGSNGMYVAFVNINTMATFMELSVASLRSKLMFMHYKGLISYLEEGELFSQYSCHIDVSYAIYKYKIKVYARQR